MASRNERERRMTSAGPRPENDNTCSLVLPMAMGALLTSATIQVKAPKKFWAEEWAPP